MGQILANPGRFEVADTPVASATETSLDIGLTLKCVASDISPGFEAGTVSDTKLVSHRGKTWICRP